MFAVTIEPLSLLGATSAKKTLHAIVSVPKPSPAMSLPVLKIIRFGAIHISNVPIAISTSPKMIVNFLPNLSAIEPVDRAPSAAPRMARLTTVSFSSLEIPGKSSSKYRDAPLTTAVS